ncbi:MAG TPA: hypothetical protein VGE45_20615 [Chloroflexia bacterium]|jgi:1,4-alpha-glucan branching enzyme
MPETLSQATIETITRGLNGDPFSVLGPHKVTHDGQPATAVRAFLPWAALVQVVTEDGTPYEMWRLHPDGFFEAVIPPDSPFNYVLRATNASGNTVDLHDPYSFGPLLTDFDLHLIREGTHYRTYEKLGAHIREVGGVRGVHFAVWAPNALRTSVIGNFNGWDARVQPNALPPGAGRVGDIPAGDRRGRGVQV